MSLPDRDAVKEYLRIENDTEDSVVDSFLLSAVGFIEEFTGRPIEATERTWTIEQRVAGCAVTSFFLPLYPVLHEADTLVTITDADDVEVIDFRVNTALGKVIATNSASFDNFPYTVVATVGLELMADYSTRVEPKLSQAVLDLCADWYQRRNPAALAEGAGGGVITQWQTLGVPERICQQLEPYRLAKAY